MCIQVTFQEHSSVRSRMSNAVNNVDIQARQGGERLDASTEDCESQVRVGCIARGCLIEKGQQAKQVWFLLSRSRPMREAGIQQIIACIAERLLGNRIQEKQHTFYRLCEQCFRHVQGNIWLHQDTSFHQFLNKPDEPRYKAGKLDKGQSGSGPQGGKQDCLPTKLQAFLEAFRKFTN